MSGGGLRYFLHRVKRKLIKIIIPERILYRLFSRKVAQLKLLGEILYPENSEECWDRYYINDYVARNKEYIYGDVLEFAGGDAVYAHKYGRGGGY